MSKKFEWEQIKNAIVDSDDVELSELKGIWYKNQRYFSNSIFTVRIEGTVAFVEYWKGELDFKSGGKAYYSFLNGGYKGDLHCPVIAKIGNTPVIVVTEIWKEQEAYPRNKYSEVIIYSYNGGYSQFDNVYEVRGNTYLLNRMFYEMGFTNKKQADGSYVQWKPTPEEAEAMTAEEAERNKLYRLAKKKEAAEYKEEKFEEFLRLHKEGKLVLVVQTGTGYSPITGIRLGEAPDGTDFVFAWIEVGKEKEIRHIHHSVSKRHLEAIGLESVEARNRWSIWFHAIKKESLEGFNLLKIDFTEYCSAWR